MLTRLCLLYTLCWSSSIASPFAVDVNTTSRAVQLPGAGRVRRAGVELASAIIAGASLAGTTTAEISKALLDNHGVSAAIEIENHTKWPLITYTTHTRWGLIKTAPPKVKPGEKETWQVHKSWGTVVGSAGLIIYKVEGLEENLVIAWHSPYNFNHIVNYLAVGLYSDEHLDELKNLPDVYDFLRNGDPQRTDYIESPSWPGCGREYYYSIVPCHIVSPNLVVTSTMGSSHAAEAHIKVYPKSASNKAN